VRTTDEDLQVVVAGAVVGEVTVLERDDHLVVRGVRLAAPEHAGVLAALLDCRAIAGSARSVVLEGDEQALGALGALAAGHEGRAWEVASQRLRLHLAGDLPPETGVRLAPMGQEAFSAYLEHLADDYVRERVDSGEAPDHARRTMQAQLGRLLPEGLESPDQHLFTGWAGDRVVGHLWVGTERPEPFVYSLDVVPEERRRGRGAALMRAAAHWARERGAAHLDLNVFGHNTAARALYASLGYQPVDTTYRRPVAR
jgi:GNAT superfamily N-acetyltransferase